MNFKNLETKNYQPPPLINAIVINKKTSEPSEGIDDFLKLGRLTGPEDRKRKIDIIQSESYNYKYWNNVLEHFKMQSAAPITSVADLKPKPQKYSNGGGGEGRAHAQFKNRISKCSQDFDIKNAEVTTEYLLPSGDAIDVLFQNASQVVGVEVKSEISDEDDIKRGLFQVVKYKAVLEASEKLTSNPREVKVFLALQKKTPNKPHFLQKYSGN